MANAVQLPAQAPDELAGGGNPGTTVVPIEKSDAVPLLAAESFPKDWHFVSAERSAKLEDSWVLKSGEAGEGLILVGSGKPYGYLRTQRAYHNYELNLEWKFPRDENGNSGVLIHTGEADKVWPTSIQVQLHRPKAGSIFPSNDDAKTLNKVEIVDLLPPVKNTWFKCKVTCIDGKVTVWINDKQAGVVTGCEPLQGFIALQSEGAEVHFRNVSIKPL